MGKKRTKAQRRAKELHEMARRSRKLERQATIMLLGGTHWKEVGLVVVRNDEGTRYYDHVSFEEMNSSQIAYRVRNSWPPRSGHR